MILVSPKTKTELTPVAKQSRDESSVWRVCPVQLRIADHRYWTVNHFIIFVLGVGQKNDETSSCNFHSFLIRNTI